MSHFDHVGLSEVIGIRADAEKVARPDLRINYVILFALALFLATVAARKHSLQKKPRSSLWATRIA